MVRVNGAITVRLKAFSEEVTSPASVEEKEGGVPLELDGV